MPPGRPAGPAASCCPHPDPDRPGGPGGPPPGRWAGACGDMAGDPEVAALLPGLGVDELGMAPGPIPEIKGLLRLLVQSLVEVVAREALGLASAEAVRGHVRRGLPVLAGLS
ncbi:MAG TPA: putative PEP-binding protein [Thermaerobacter sp.]